jgi:circadian clock protein KaiC
MHDLVASFEPDIVVVDPISNLSIEPDDQALKPTLIRLIDFLKQQGVTALFTSLTSETAFTLAQTEIGVSSLMDTWLLMSNREANGERTRTIQVVKSRGMPHSNQVREFLIGEGGVRLVDRFAEGNHVLTGFARTHAQAQLNEGAVGAGKG